MSIREQEDHATIAYRWARSMGSGKILGPQRERDPRDVAHQQARDDANNAGADAWSPSRAREALRKFRGLRTHDVAHASRIWLNESQAILKAAERLNAYADEESFELFCLDRGIPVALL